MICVSDLIVDHPTPDGPFRALDCPALTIPTGTSVAITGPSGCGKSTFLGMIAGIATPTKGSIAIDGITVTALSETDRTAFRKRNLGVVYQRDNLLPFLNVTQNVRLQLAICGDTNGADARCAHLLERLGMADFADRLPDQLSGGQRQRVAVARAIVHAPMLILADEPTGALDARNAAEVMALLEEARESLGATLVIVTHDPDVAAAQDRTIALAAGKVVADTGGQA